MGGFEVAGLLRAGPIVCRVGPWPKVSPLFPDAFAQATFQLRKRFAPVAAATIGAATIPVLGADRCIDGDGSVASSSDQSSRPLS